MKRAKRGAPLEIELAAIFPSHFINVLPDCLRPFHMGAGGIESLPGNRFSYGISDGLILLQKHLTGQQGEFESELNSKNPAQPMDAVKQIGITAMEIKRHNIPLACNGS